MTAQELAVYRKVTWRIMPVLFFCYILAYIDRVNVSFAKLSLSSEAWFSDAVFATGAGIFFLGYFFFEVPGNVILHRVGARLWIARIMIGWGLVSGLMALSSSASSFYTLRFLLGVAEAGFFPGIILYLTYWYPRKLRARMVAVFMTAIAVSGVIGSPLSGWLLKVTDGWHGLAAWQWLFIIESIPTVLMGIAVPFVLTDRPGKARWLTDEEKKLLEDNMARDEQTRSAEGHHAHRVLDAFKSPKVWLFSGIYFSAIVGLYGSSFWLPQIIKDNLTKDEWMIGLYSSVPWTVAAIGMVLVGRHSDQTGERRWHVATSSLVAAVAFAVSGLPGLPPFAILAALTVAITGVMSTISCFWALPTAILAGAAAAAGIAWINSLGNLAGYIAPEMVAWLRKHHDMQAALTAVGAAMAVAAILVLLGTRPAGKAGSKRD